MRATKPTLGYTSVTEAVLALSAEGRSRREIATMVGRSTSAVAAFYNSGMRNGVKKRELISIPHKTLRALRAAADARGIGPAELSRRLLAVVAADGMVDAILDDREDGE